MRVMGVDPGTVTCGVGFVDLDERFNIINSFSFTIVIDSKIDLNERLNILYHRLKGIIVEYNPYLLVHEAGFINRFRPQAYGPIYASIYLINRAWVDIKGRCNIFSYPPKLVKSLVSTGNADKNDMLYAINNNPELNVFLTGFETEHEVDALLIAYSHILNIRQTPELLLL